MTTMTCCGAQYATVAASMDHKCEPNVKIVMTTERPGERKGRIEGLPVARSQAIAILAEHFGLSVNGWMFNKQTQIKGETLFIYTLVTV